MTKEELFVFISEISKKSSVAKIGYVLDQLEAILKSQGAGDDLLSIIIVAKSSVPEIRSFVQVVHGETLSEENMKIIEERASNRRQNEKMMSQQGRC